MKCNKCNHINEPKNLEFDKVIRIPDDCYNCIFYIDSDHPESMLCRYYEEWIKKDGYDRPDFCELVYLETWKKKEQE